MTQFDIQMKTHSAVVVALGVMAGPLAAQGVTAGFGVLSAHHELLGKPLIGEHVTVRFRPLDSRVAFRVGAQIARSGSDRFGTTCYGLVNPFDPASCPRESIRDDGHLSQVFAGAELRLLHAARLELGLTADLGLGHVAVESRGSTGNSLHANKKLGSAFVGAAVTWYPVARIPIGIDAQAALGRFTPLSMVMVADGYEPFDADFRVRSVSLGLAWRPRRP